MKTILIIEDDFLVQESLEEVLSAEGFKIITATDGLAGVETAKTLQPDLIICDLMIPDLNGYEILSQVRSLISTKTIPLIFLTVKSDFKDFRKAMVLGADDYLRKPLVPEDLLTAVRTQLQKKSAIKEKYQLQGNDFVSYDQLTGLPNRLLVRQQFEQLQNQSFLPVLLLSIDQFQRFKEIFGYEVGETLLKQATSYLQAVVSTNSFLAHLSSNDFLVILTGVANKEEVSAIAEKILSAIAQPFLIEDEQEITITASLGISFYPEHNQTIDLLLKQANQARKLAQKKGGNCSQIYHCSTTKNNGCSTLTLETDLKYALKREELVLYYQPRVNLKTGKIVGLEALVRWLHPEFGKISPNSFISIAEETGLITGISDWVYYRACKQIKEWQETLKVSLKMAVNLSAYEFNVSDLCQRIEGICQEINLSPHCLELELTENMLVSDFPKARAKLEQLQALGIQIAIDDFGVGYSSMSYLQQFSFQILKLDRSFISNLGENLVNRNIVISLIQLAHSLNLSVVAEGVERSGELVFLKEQHCDEMQGFIFSPPISASKIEELLKENPCLPI